jgi:crotonobetainyl-CoA:carnitine CoA-transferase CaiB-like acyl-CoA transferase
MAQFRPAAALALHGQRVLSLSLNLPGPAALQRLRAMGARCVKIEPPTAADGSRADPMQRYGAQAYADLHNGVHVLQADLKTPRGQHVLHHQLARSDVLLTSFRPSACAKLGLDAPTLRQRYPRLVGVSIVGSPGAGAEEAGHDLTYQAKNGLVDGLKLPQTLLADMGGALLATEAVLHALLWRAQSGQGSFTEVALSDATAHLALPQRWGITAPGTLLGGGHAGYRVYPCRDGRVALAALEPHFAQRLCAQLGLAWQGPATVLQASAHAHIAQWMALRTCAELDALAQRHDIPLETLPKI